MALLVEIAVDDYRIRYIILSRYVNIRANYGLYTLF